MAKLVLPRVQAMVLCDALEESAQESGVFHLSGVRSTIEGPLFPYSRPRLCVYLQVSGHAGQVPCRIEITRTETDEVIYRTAPREISFEGPMSVVPVVFRLRNCGFPAPGVYYVQIYCESKLIGERPLHLVLGEN
jgi:hypothetical protein